MTCSKLHPSLVDTGIILDYPDSMKGWHCYRIEYGKKYEPSYPEGVIYLPPDADPMALEVWFNECCKKNEDTTSES